MVLLHLVRHARAAAGWDRDPDPPLDAVGRAQALALADTVGPLGPLPLLVSPLRRTRETAQPLAERWRVAPLIEPAIAEIPSPEGISIEDRVGWLRMAMAGCWSDLEPRYVSFRDLVLARLRDIDTETIVVSHFVAINAVVGAALGNDRLVTLSLDNASRTVVDVDGDGRFRLVEAGHEADTLIR